VSADPILAHESLGAAVGGPVTGTLVGNKRYLDTAGSPAFATRIDEASATVTYVAKAEPGTLNDEAGWQIQRITVSGNVTSIEWADGNAGFDNVWNDRASLTYS
jgi:hypothetical protein